MTGGVSLAIWMGGVRPRSTAVHGEDHYGSLLEALDSVGVRRCHHGLERRWAERWCLTAAVTRQLPVGQFNDLRDTWMRSGSFTELSRCRGAQPTELLRGDSYFRKEIERVLRSWLRPQPRGLDGGARFDLVLTATTLAAEPIEHTDDLGTKVIDPRHRARFCFDENLLRTDTESRSNVLARQLALAAGSVGPPSRGLRSLVRPRRFSGRRSGHEGNRQLRELAWAIDGGVLLNKPIGPALDVIRDRRPERDGKRAPLYVNPDPGDRGRRRRTTSPNHRRWRPCSPRR